MGFFAKDIGIDLGTANTLISVKGRGIVIREPSVVAIDKYTNNVIAIGNSAKEMLGRTPENLEAKRPLKDGVIADFTATKRMLKHFVEKACQKYIFARPRVVVGVPLGVTEVESSAVEEAVLEAGAREVFLIEEPMAAAIGAGLKVSEASGSMIVDMGGGTSEIAVISLGGIVTGKSIRIAGDELNEAIIEYVKKEFNVLLGETSAEEVKLNIGCAYPSMTVEEKVGLLVKYLRGMNDKLNIPQCIKNYGADSYPTEQGFVPEDVFLDRLHDIAVNAVADACTGSNPRQPSVEDMEKLLKCVYYDCDVDF